MQWFEQFVAETVDLWLEVHPADARVASFREWLEDFEASSSETGQCGEQVVLELVRERGYAATTSKRSLTPADVWGARRFGAYLHVALFQVKTSVEAKPRRLTDKEQMELEDLAGFVGSRLGKSVFVPEEVQALPRMISTGYAGVVLEPVEFRGNLESAFRLDLIYSKSLEDALPELRKLAFAAHHLGDR